MTTGPLEGEPIAASEHEQSAIAQIATVLEASPETVKLVGPNGVEFNLPASLFDVLKRAVRVMSNGEAIAIVPVHKELTTRQAAEILHVSRQYFVTLLDSGKIEYAKTGTHRRVKFADLMAFKEHRDIQRRKGLDELTRRSDELGLYEVSLGGECRRLELP